MNRRLPAALALVVSAAGLSTLGQLPAHAATSGVPRPLKFVSHVASGPGVGQLTISWSKVRSPWKPRTTGFRIETATTQFSPYHSTLPLHGRNSHVFSVGPKARKLVLSEATLAKAGAPLASGNHLYVRVWSVDKVKHRAARTYSDGKLLAVFPRGMASTGTGSVLRLADYNVRVAGQDGGTAHDWYDVRLPLVARNIASQAPGIVTLQEANPTAYTSSGAVDVAHPDHTQLGTLLNQVNVDSAGSGARYALVRTTRYAKPGTLPQAQQGERIMYDTTRYSLIDNCPEMTGSSKWNASCTVRLPETSPNGLVHANNTRWGVYGHFEDKATHQNFWAVSVHLDNVGKKTDSLAKQRAADDLRRAQVQAVLDQVASLNAGHEPVLFAGDLNTFENSMLPHGYAAHDLLVSKGFYDTFAAASRSGYQYDTENDYGANAAIDKSGIGARIDTIMTQGIRGADSWKHVRFRGPQGQYPSDHDMIVATFKLP